MGKLTGIKLTGIKRTGITVVDPSLFLPGPTPEIIPVMGK